jgi:uncharacterized protein (TIGR02453 family)
VRSPFPGFPSEGIDFFKSLARHNKREWFQSRKHVFEEQVKHPMLALVEAVNTALRGFAPDFVTEPSKAVYRIYRDTRFSKDKTPYKTHIAASFHRRNVANHSDAGYYFAISHKEVAIGGGIYMPDPAALLAIRNHIASHHQGFRRILRVRAVRELLGEVQGEQLSRVPKGFPSDHPAVDLLRFKQMFLYVELAPDLATSPSLYTEIIKRFRVMVPFLDFLSAPLAPTRKKIDARELLL